MRFGYGNSSSNVSLENNILWTDNGYDLYVATDSQVGFSSDYNNLYTANPAQAALVWWQKSFTDLFDWQVESGYDTHSIGYTAPAPTRDDPLFVNLAADDYQLSNYISTSIDAGNPTSARIYSPTERGSSLEPMATRRKPHSRPHHISVSTIPTTIPTGPSTSATRSSGIRITSPATSVSTFTIRRARHC